VSRWALNRYVRAISHGAVFAYPTDTVWGLGCHPLIAGAVLRLLKIKQRPVEKGLILLASRLEQCLPYLAADENELEPLKRPAERPTTWLVAAGDGCPPWIRGQHPTVAVRITDHPLVAQLCTGIDAPLVSTSANRSGRPTVRSALQAQRQLGADLDFIIGGYNTGGNRPSEIKSLAGGKVLRSAN